MYHSVDTSNRPATHSGYSGHPAPDAPRNYRANGDYYYYPQDTAQENIPYSSSRQYSAAGDLLVTNSTYTPQHTYNSPLSHGYSNSSAYSVADYPTQEFPVVMPSLSRRSDSQAISTPLPKPKQSTQTPVAASTSDSWTPAVNETSIQPVDPPKKKTRREKPKIALAPDQPPTTQGKPRARVYVACLQCRTRKIRCDGAKPICHNCGRRSGGGSDCNYDPVPRRRGPDKLPGARQRMARELREEDTESHGTRRRRRRREPTPENPQSNQYGRDGAIVPLAGSLSPTSSSDYNISPSYLVPPNTLPSPQLFGGGCACHGLVQCPNSQPYVSSRTEPISAYAQTTVNYPVLKQLENVVSLDGVVSPGHISSSDDGQESDDVTDISNEPSIRFSRKIWYETLCSLYASVDTGQPKALTRTDRESVTQRIASDLRFLFRVSNYWFSFFHIPSFFGTFFDPVARENIQPSLVLAALALSTFWQSSELGKGQAGRTQALRLRDEAQSALDASFNAGSIDETLAQAAWLLALFEVCAHPAHSTTRSVSAIVMLDSIIRCLALTYVDADDPDTSVFPAGQVPRIDSSASSNRNPSYLSHLDPSYHSPSSSPSDSGTPGTTGCNCLGLTLGEHWPSSLEHTPMWATTPAWDPSWSASEIRKESSRRLCWSAISLAAGHVSYATASQTHIPQLFLADPSNFALLFSGESLCRSPSLSTAPAKDTVWALYDRSFLLWHICARVRADTSMSDVQKGEFAVKAWLETDAIEMALNKHTCGIEKAYIFQGREYLFNTRISISFEFQRYIPLVNSDVSGFFHRKKAEEWLTHQAAVAQRFMHGLHTITGNSSNLLAQRPFFVFWIMSQILRSLRLWHCDKSLIIALDVCKAFLPAVDYLSCIWPCNEQRKRYLRIRDSLTEACYTAGIPNPPSPNFSLSDHVS